MLRITQGVLCFLLASVSLFVIRRGRFSCMLVCNSSNTRHKCHLVVRKGCGSWREAQVRPWAVTPPSGHGNLSAYRCEEAWSDTSSVVLPLSPV